MTPNKCLLSTAALHTQLVEAPYVPDSFYAYVAENLPARIVTWQRERLTLPARQEQDVQCQRGWLLSAASQAELDTRQAGLSAIESERVPNALGYTPPQTEVIMPDDRDGNPFLD